MLTKYCPDCHAKMDGNAETKMFCRRCRNRYTKRPDSLRFEATRQYLDSPDSDIFRQKILSRDDFCCQTHLRSGRGAKANRKNAVDHIIPRHIRPDLIYVMDNAETLCASCHNRKTWWEEHGRIITWNLQKGRWAVHDGTDEQLKGFAELEKISNIVRWPGVSLSNLPTQVIVVVPNSRESFIVAQRISGRPFGFI